MPFSGGATHAPACFQPQPPAGRQHGSASMAVGMNILIKDRAEPAGLVQVVAPHITDVAPAPAAPALAPAAVAAGVVPTAGVCAPDAGSLLLPHAAIIITPAIAATQPLVFVVFIAARLSWCTQNAQRSLSTRFWGYVLARFDIVPGRILEYSDKSGCPDP